MGIRSSGPRSEEDVRRISERLSIERDGGVKPTDPNSLLYGLPANHPLVTQYAGAPDTASAGSATQPPAAPSIASPEAPKPFRGGSAAFESTMDAFGDRQKRMETDGQFASDTLGALMAGKTPPKAPNIQTPGEAYKPNNEAVGLRPEEKAGGASATTSKAGTPGQYGVNALPQGFSAYQNRDGGWTVQGPDGKPQKFASEQEASAFLNQQSPAATPGVPVGAVPPSGALGMRPVPGLLPSAPAAASASIHQNVIPTPGGGMVPVNKTPPPSGGGGMPTAAFGGFRPQVPGVIQRFTNMIAPPAPAVPPSPPANPNVLPTPQALQQAPAPSAKDKAVTQRSVDASVGAMDAMIANPPLPAVNLRPPVKKPVERQAQAVADQYNPFQVSNRARVFPY